MDKVIVVIPCYNPNIELFDKLLKELKAEFKNVIIVNDGSDKIFDEYFNELKKDYPLLTHYVNLGKGRALKTAFNYILNNYQGYDAIVTADADGQHLVKDIKKCALEAIKYPDSLVLGKRDFDKKNVPFKSRYGNKITRNIFKLFVGISISDTQTGLRAMSLNVASKLLDIAGERYEYETKTLIACQEKDIPLKEVPISTVYINDNKTSHFHPIRDSYMIYRLFFKYIFSAISSYLIELIFFSIFLSIFSHLSLINSILITTIVSRIISSIYNYFVNARLVFKKASNSSIIKYFILVIIQMFASGIIVSLIVNGTLLNTYLVKIIVDAIIFIVNFIIQREWVFKK